MPKAEDAAGIAIVNMFSFYKTSIKYISFDLETVGDIDYYALYAQNGDDNITYYVDYTTNRLAIVKTENVDYTITTTYSFSEDLDMNVFKFDDTNYSCCKGQVESFYYEAPKVDVIKTVKLKQF